MDNKEEIKKNELELQKQVTRMVTTIADLYEGAKKDIDSGKYANAERKSEQAEEIVRNINSLVTQGRC